MQLFGRFLEMRSRSSTSWQTLSSLYMISVSLSFSHLKSMRSSTFLILEPPFFFLSFEDCCRIKDLSQSTDSAAYDYKKVRTKAHRTLQHRKVSFSSTGELRSKRCNGWRPLLGSQLSSIKTLMLFNNGYEKDPSPSAWSKFITQVKWKT